jgi:hypothetical protein
MAGGVRESGTAAEDVEPVSNCLILDSRLAGTYYHFRPENVPAIARREEPGTLRPPAVFGKKTQPDEGLGLPRDSRRSDRAGPAFHFLCCVRQHAKS